MRHLPLLERFWSRIDKSGDEDSCWNWTAGTGTTGYGSLVHNGKRIGAHRLSYELANGAIPDGLWVLHKCDNRKCVNPAHLFLGTQKDNIADMDRKGRRRSTPLPGEKNPRHKINSDQVRYIRERYAVGDISMSQLARATGVSKGTVYDIVRRRSWIDFP